MTFEKKDIRQCILLALQLKKNAAKMIRCALDEAAAIYITYKSWYKRFREGDFNLKDKGTPPPI